MGGYRGRLIFPFVCEIAPIDLVATYNVGYDADFKEPVIVASTDKLGTSARTEGTSICVKGQFSPGTNAFLQLQQAAAGNLATIEFVILFHFSELEACGLIEETTGLAKIKVGDRLCSISDVDGNLVQKIPAVPGAYVTKAAPIFGLRGTRNLLEVTFRSRDTSGQGS